MPRTILHAAFAVTLFAATAGSCFADSGADTYKAKCQMCHGTDGMGATPAGKAMKAIPFNDPQLVAKSDADLIAATNNGKGKMPAYKDKLSAADIKAVIGFIRTFQKK